MDLRTQLASACLVRLFQSVRYISGASDQVPGPALDQVGFHPDHFWLLLAPFSTGYLHHTCALLLQANAAPGK